MWLAALPRRAGARAALLLRRDDGDGDATVADGGGGGARPPAPPPGADAAERAAALEAHVRATLLEPPSHGGAERDEAARVARRLAEGWDATSPTRVIRAATAAVAAASTASERRGVAPAPGGTAAAAAVATRGGADAAGGAVAVRAANPRRLAWPRETSVLHAADDATAPIESSRAFVAALAELDAAVARAVGVAPRVEGAASREAAALLVEFDEGGHGESSSTNKRS